MIRGEYYESVEKVFDAVNELFGDAEALEGAIYQLLQEEGLTESERELLEKMRSAIEAVNSAQCQMYDEQCQMYDY